MTDDDDDLDNRDDSGEDVMMITIKLVMKN